MNPTPAEVASAAERLRGDWYAAYGCTGEGLQGDACADIELVAIAASRLPRLVEALRVMVGRCHSCHGTSLCVYCIEARKLIAEWEAVK